MSTAQSAVSLLGEVRLDNVDVDLGLCWDPLVTDSDVLAELLADRHLTPGQTNSTYSLSTKAAQCLAFVMSLSQ